LLALKAGFGNELAEFSDPGSVEDFISGFADLLVEDGFIREDSMEYMSYKSSKKLHTHIRGRIDSQDTSLGELKCRS
jgi:hypothetical protein